MYLATLRPRKSPLSTYFIAILDPVGGGGTHKKARAKNTGKKTKQLNIIVSNDVYA